MPKATVSKAPVKRSRSSKGAAKLMGSVRTAAYRSPALDYDTPVLQKVAAKIKAVDKAFLPAESGAAILKAYIPSGAPIQMPFRTLVEVDCGVDIDLPAGYKLNIQALPGLSAKGVFVTHNKVLGSSRVKVYVTNMGREIIMLRNADQIATVEVEQMCFFDWIVRE